MQSKQACTFIIAISFFIAGCQSDADKHDPEAASSTSDRVVPSPENNPEDVFLAWQLAMDLSKYQEARQWSSPATQDWIALLEDLASQSDSPPVQTVTSIESIQCTVFGDTAICFFAEERDQMLQLDSIRMVRLQGKWKVDLQEDISSQTTDREQ